MPVLVDEPCLNFVDDDRVEVQKLFDTQDLAPGVAPPIFATALGDG